MTPWQWHEFRQSFGAPKSFKNLQTGFAAGADRDLDGKAKLPGTEKDFADFETYRMEYRPMLTDEQWMWLAQIDSVLSILHHGPKRRDPAEYEEARRWVESREYYIGSFEFVCDLFVGYDSEAMREALLAIVPNGGRRYAARPSGSQCGPRPAVSALTPKSRRKVGYNKPQEVAA